MSEKMFARLRAQGFRITPQRVTILQVMREAGGHLMATEVYQRASALLPGLTEATVYRTLDFLSGQGILMVGHVGSGNLVYELAESVHHHLICRSCGRSVEISHELLAPLYENLQCETGYQLDSRHVTLFGLCPECQGNGRD